MKIGLRVQSVIAGDIRLCLLAQELMMNKCLTVRIKSTECERLEFFCLSNKCVTDQHATHQQNT